MYATAVILSIRWVTQNPMVTAGLKWPPETPPNADTMRAMARPCAKAIAIIFPVIIIDDTPTNTRVNAPIASAINLGKSSEEDK